MPKARTKHTRNDFKELVRPALDRLAKDYRFYQYDPHRKDRIMEEVRLRGMELRDNTDISSRVGTTPESIRKDFMALTRALREGKGRESERLAKWLKDARGLREEAITANEALRLHSVNRIAGNTGIGRETVARHLREIERTYPAEFVEKMKKAREGPQPTPRHTLEKNRKDWEVLADFFALKNPTQERLAKRHKTRQESISVRLNRVLPYLPPSVHALFLEKQRQVRRNAGEKIAKKKKGKRKFTQR